MSVLSLKKVAPAWKVLPWKALFDLKIAKKLAFVSLD